MNYSEIYPNLSKVYKKRNFEALAQALDKYFPDLFKLDVLNAEAAKSDSAQGGYYKLFIDCITRIDEYFTAEEMVWAINQELHKEEHQIDLLQQFTFVPQVGNHKSTQIGYFEKLATAELKILEPLTRLDLMRVAHGIKISQDKLRKNIYYRSNNKLDVAHLKHIECYDQEQIQVLKKCNDALIINVNRDLNGTPKWTILDLQSKPRLYCESVLLENEKEALDDALKISIDSYEGAIANNAISTGYTAIAWLNNHITKTIDINEDSDFSSLRSEFIYLCFTGDNPGLTYRFYRNEQDLFCTKAFNNVLKYNKKSIGNKVQPGYIIYRLAFISILNEIKGQAIKQHDLAEVTRIFGESEIFGESGSRPPRAIEQYFNIALYTMPPCFDSTILEYPNLVKEGRELSANGSTRTSVTLNVPSNIPFYELNKKHIEVCDKLNIYAGWLESLSEPSFNTREEKIASMMVSTLIRSKDKKSIISITLPEHYQLMKDQIQFLISCFDNNPYVTEFEINNNKSLQTVKENILPILARNRWLAENSYLPPLIANFWREAAKYWLVHLNEYQDLSNDAFDQEVFKDCVLGMGLRGLAEVLSLLNDPFEREQIEQIYGNNKATFYAACHKKDFEVYVNKLIEHMSTGAYFPFKEIAMGYQEAQEPSLLRLYQAINQLEKFEKLSLYRCPIHQPKTMASLFSNLIKMAQNESWHVLIHIPELEENEKQSRQIQALRKQYTLLNDIILANSHKRFKNTKNNDIKAASSFSIKGKEKAEAKGKEKQVLENDAAIDLQEEIKRVQLSLKADDSWRLNKGSVTQLQLQQQQQIEQNRQIQQEQQKVVVHRVEAPLPQLLIDYDNIDEHLGQYFNQYRQDHLYFAASAMLGQDNESLLQKFFHTWINATPNVPASHVIKKMTPAAAKHLIYNHRLLASGLMLDNLPKGFYTQRTKKNELILCYSPEKAYINPPTPFTLKLEHTIPQAIDWHGDFRQFDLPRYIDGKEGFDEKDWQYISLFAELQPKKDHYAKDLEQFLKNNPKARQYINESGEEKILNHWHTFNQLWQYEGIDGIQKFLEVDENTITLDEREIAHLLFEYQSKTLKVFVEKWQPNKTALRSLGQLYHIHGNEALSLYLTKLCQIQQSLGNEFFQTYSKIIIEGCENLNYYFKPNFFICMDRMIERLSPQNAEAHLSLWQKMIEKHYEAVHWDNIETLWQSYDYFLNEIEQLGLGLKGHEFNAIKPGNMIVHMDRILLDLKQIPDQEEKITYLKQLATLDLTHGGHHYAIQYEHFKHIDSRLALRDFWQGDEKVQPAVYAPDVKQIFYWQGNTAPLKTIRLIASKAQFSRANFEMLVDKLGDGSLASREHLIWLVHTQCTGEVIEMLDLIQTIEPKFKSMIAKHLHQAVYEAGQQKLEIDLNAMKALENDKNLHSNLLNKFPQGTALEATSILWRSGQWDKVDALIHLLSHSLQPDSISSFLYNSSLKLATTFNALDPEKLKAFYEKTNHLIPLVQRELRLLISQVLSIDFDNSELASLTLEENWQDLLDCIEKMSAEPTEVSKFRLEFIEKLCAAGLQFKYSKSGLYRALESREKDGPQELGFFTDHEDRLWHFLQSHILIPVNDADAQTSLKPIMLFLKQLQMNQSYLNEIEPLLSILENTAPTKYWTAEYFYLMLKTLQPVSEDISFPIALLKIMLPEPAIAAKAIDAVDNEFPQHLCEPIQLIIQNTVFSRHQQAILLKIALNEFEWNAAVEVLHQVMGLLSDEVYAESRDYALEIFSKTKNYQSLRTNIDHCSALLQHESSHIFPGSWNKTSAIWLETLVTHKESTEKLFGTIMSDYNGEKQAKLLHIIAHSCLSQGLRKKDVYLHELNTIAPRILNQLGQLSEDKLDYLASCYPKVPAPGADDLRRILKTHHQGAEWKTCIDSFLCNPYPEPRADYARLTATREADFHRMIRITSRTSFSSHEKLSQSTILRLSVIFRQIKDLEAGNITLGDFDKPIREMNQKELAEAFQMLSRSSENNTRDDLIRAGIWTVLFEVIGRTTRKYPHMAQQFALIADEIAINANVPHILQLATGEGKSHFQAMRAARQAGLGKTVDICTAKRSLARRDAEDYGAFFDYLELNSAYIHPKSERESYINTDIHFSTMGDISLFLDEQSYLGQPIPINRSQRVALFDEFDFIRFEEGRKTEYNYARPTGKTPKQMIWFYQAVNAFYNQNRPILLKTEQITADILINFVNYLTNTATEHEQKQLFLKDLFKDKLKLVQWLQSAHEAHTLEWGGKNGFTVREVNIDIGDESYPMREIIPLSSDSQPMLGSTFSAGVHQLVATRLNTEAKALPHDVSQRLRAQNFHVHPESNIISSQVAEQRMKELYGHWEGFSGTISELQAKKLNREMAAEVLHVTTNQADLRQWHQPQFFANEEARRAILVKQIQSCLDNNESILFSCQSDAHVKAMEVYLKDHLSESHLAQLIFYTNEEDRTPEQVLKDKKDMEQWSHGRKQKGIGLVAAGFGRGDNVAVENVFLFDVNDANDKIQKGGRTARNGEAGAVYQFYLSPELQNEEKRLTETIRKLKDSTYDIDQIFSPHILADNDESDLSEHERQFERVMILRELVFNLQNEANGAYRNNLAQLSSWFMSQLAVIEDPDIREKLVIHTAHCIKELEKRWIDISSGNLPIQQEIEAIEQEVKKFAKHIENEFKTQSPQHHEEFQLKRTTDSASHDKVEALHEETALSTEIYHLICRLPGAENQSELLLSVQKNINILLDSGHLSLLRELALDLYHVKDFKEIEQKSCFAVDRLNKPSNSWADILKEARQTKSADHFFDAVDEPLKLEFDKCMRHLREDIKERLIRKLSEPDLRSSTTRIKALLPILHYLNRFDYKNQLSFASDYIEHLDLFEQQIPAEFAQVFFKDNQLRNYAEFYTMWRLASQITKHADDLILIMQTLDQCLSSSCPQRLRILNTWELWSASMNSDMRKTFLINFCKIINHFNINSNDWDNFKGLSDKTTEWWHKGRASNYQPELLSLWQFISEHHYILSETPEFIRFCLSIQSKSWVSLVQIGWKNMEAVDLERYVRIFDNLWHNSNLSQKDKLLQFNELADLINHFNEQIYASNELKETLVYQTGQVFLHFLRFMKINEVVLSRYPQIAACLLTYLDKEGGINEHAEVFELLLLMIANYCDSHPHADIEDLIDAARQYIDKPKREQAELTSIFDSYQPLFDNTPQYLVELQQRLPDASIDKIKTIIVEFNQIVIASNFDIVKIMQESRMKKWFDFNDDSQSENRVILMHLLNHEKLIAEANPSSLRLWKKEDNNQLVNQCLQEYVDYFKTMFQRDYQKPELTTPHNLSVEQQTKLLCIGEEFQRINRIETVLDANHIAPLRSELTQLIQHYQACWFKSDSRKRYAIVLNNKFLDAFRENEGNQYEKCLAALREIKQEVIEEDQRENNQRWFKLHRNGQSRLYNTLKQMEEVVLKHWSMDKKENISLIDYQKVLVENNKLIKHQLIKATEQYLKNYYDCDSDNYNNLPNKLKRFFGSKDTHQSLGRLKHRLEGHNCSSASEKDLSALQKYIKSVQKDLPGHLNVLAENLLTDTEALKQFNIKAETYKAQRGISFIEC